MLREKKAAIIAGSITWGGCPLPATIFFGSPQTPAVLYNVLSFINKFGSEMIRQSQLCSILVALSVVALISCNPQSAVESKREKQSEQIASIEQIAKLQGKVRFTLEDGEALNREHPDTFWIPQKERREKLVKDDLVKLVFNLTDGRKIQAERMWVIVKAGDRSGYSGVLDNDPYCTDQIKAGLEVSFMPRHVIDIFEDESAENDKAEPSAAANPAERAR